MSKLVPFKYTIRNGAYLPGEHSVIINTRYAKIIGWKVNRIWRDYPKGFTEERVFSVVQDEIEYSSLEASPASFIDCDALRPARNLRVYYGIKEEFGPMTPEDIMASSYITIGHRENFIIKYRENIKPRYYWMAEPISQPFKTNWEDTIDPENKGTIAKPGDRFGFPIAMQNFRLYQTENPENFPNPIKFLYINSGFTYTFSFNLA